MRIHPVQNPRVAQPQLEIGKGGLPAEFELVPRRLLRIGFRQVRANPRHDLALLMDSQVAQLALGGVGNSGSGRYLRIQDTPYPAWRSSSSYFPSGSIRPKIAIASAWLRTRPSSMPMAKWQSAKVYRFAKSFRILG